MITPVLLDPNDVDLIASDAVFGDFSIPRIYKLDELGCDVFELESNMVARLWKAYSATWGLEISAQPLKPMLEKLYQRVYDDQLSGRGVYSVNETNELVAQLQRLLGITENDSDDTHD